MQGRTVECQMLDRMVDAVHAGESRVLVLCGEAGIGKTALLEHLAGRARDCRIARAAGVQSEMELAFSGLHQLCVPLLDRLAALPAPQREALGTAFGLQAGVAPDRFFVGLAVLSLLSEAAAARPLVCIIDDAHWLDHASAQTLAFAARRLFAESVAMVFATREVGPELAALPRSDVHGLAEEDARRLLATELRGPLDARVRDRIVAESRGNPLALLELPRGVPPAQLAGGFVLPDAPALQGRIEESFRARLDLLPTDARRLLLVAAAEPLGDPVLVWRAAGLLGIERPAAEPAESAGLVELGPRVRFRHPLVRSAVYRSAPPEERRSVHHALAAATDAELDPDRRAWHRAQAAAGPDEAVAAELERSAGRAQARGGFAAAAAFLERAVRLTPEPSRRARRALAAAEAKHQAGAAEAALALLATVAEGSLEPVDQARVDLLHGQIAWAMKRGSDAPPLLLRAARRLEPLDARLARETYREALRAAMYAGRLAGDAGPRAVAAALRGAARPPAPERAPDALLDALAVFFTDGPAAGAPLVRRALAAFREESLPPDERLGWLWIACRSAHEVWDADAWRALAGEYVALARDTGAFTVLTHALATRAGSLLYSGDLAAARGLAEEEAAILRTIGLTRPVYAAVAVAAWQGREAPVRTALAETTERAQELGEGQWLTLVNWSSAILENALGHFDEARRLAERATADPLEMGIAAWALPELVEAAVRSGRAEQAAGALARLGEIAPAGAADWGLGTYALARAVLEGEERLYAEAIERLTRAGMRAIAGRAHLLYGEWLRLQSRRQDAREQLGAAHGLFTSIGAHAFAERARRELLATGAAAGGRASVDREALTAQEAHIAQLAHSGLSNPEIAARLFISPRTVQYHLHKVFAKLGISSRGELAGVLERETVRSAG